MLSTEQEISIKSYLTRVLILLMLLQIFVMFNSVRFVLHANKFSFCIFVMSCSDGFVSDMNKF